MLLFIWIFILWWDLTIVREHVSDFIREEAHSIGIDWIEKDVPTGFRPVKYPVGFL